MALSDSRAHPAFGRLLRALHWGLALSVVMLIVTSQVADLFEHSPREKLVWHLHIFTGYALSVFLVLRLGWGLVGTGSARWQDMWHPEVWKESLRTRRLPTAHRVGHDPVASLAYLFAYGVISGMVVTGLGLAATKFHTGPLAGLLGGMSWLKPLLMEPHEAGFALMLGFVGLHLAALVWHQRRGERVAQSMITGKQYLDPTPAAGAEHPPS